MVRGGGSGSPCSSAADAPDGERRMGRGAPSGERVEVLWGDEWFAGTFTSSRRTTDADGMPVRLHRIWYDASGPWAAEGDWHDLDDTEWRRIQT